MKWLKSLNEENTSEQSEMFSEGSLLQKVSYDKKQNKIDSYSQYQALQQWGIKMSIPKKAINKYTDWNHKMIFNALFQKQKYSS